YCGGTGCGTAVDWVGTSDCRCKKCIEKLDCGLDRIMNLKPVSYQWKHDDSCDMGFIAQDVIEYEKTLVLGNEEDGYGLKYDKISAITVKAIQELKEEIEKLKEQVNG
ncbi:unnamed protein product, partial [marine sediment metagenome]